MMSSRCKFYLGPHCKAIRLLFIRGGRSSFDPKSLDWTPYLPSRKRDTDEIFIPIQYGKSLHGSVRIAMNNDDRVRLWDNDAYWQNRWDYQKTKTPWSMANNFHDWFRGERQRQKFPEHVARVYRGNNLMVTFYTPQKSYGGDAAKTGYYDRLADDDDAASEYEKEYQALLRDVIELSKQY
eukprot:646663_1